jgi:hypothetical protein
MSHSVVLRQYAITFWRRPAFGDTQRRSQGKTQGKFVPIAFPRLREGHKHVQSPG